MPFTCRRKGGLCPWAVWVDCRKEVALELALEKGSGAWKEFCGSPAEAWIGVGVCFLEGPKLKQGS